MELIQQYYPLSLICQTLKTVPEDEPCAIIYTNGKFRIICNKGTTVLALENGLENHSFYTCEKFTMDNHQRIIFGWMDKLFYRIEAFPFLRNTDGTTFAKAFVRDEGRVKVFSFGKHEAYLASECADDHPNAKIVCMKSFNKDVLKCFPNIELLVMPTQLEAKFEVLVMYPSRENIYKILSTLP